MEQFFFFFFFYHLFSLLSSGGKAFNKLKKVGKTTRPFRYDVNPIPYDYTVDVRNRFKGLDLTDRVPAELWTEVVTLYRRQGLRPSPWKKNWGTYTRMTSPKFNWKKKKKMPIYLICSNFKLVSLLPGSRFLIQPQLEPAYKLCLTTSAKDRIGLWQRKAFCNNCPIITCIYSSYFFRSFPCHFVYSSL